VGAKIIILKKSTCSSERPTISPVYKRYNKFSGCGGFDLGFHRTGFDIRWANEYNKYACETYRHHFPFIRLIEKDIRFIKANEFPRDIDVIIGGFF